MKVTVLFSLFLSLFATNLSAQEIKYVTSNNGWNADSLGNQRALVSISTGSSVAKVSIDWRRSDPFPERKAIIVTAVKTGKTLSKVLPLSIDREKGVICFEPIKGVSTYYVYYQPYKNEGRSNYPKGTYPEQERLVGNWISKKEAERLPVNSKLIQLVH